MTTFFSTALAGVSLVASLAAPVALAADHGGHIDHGQGHANGHHQTSEHAQDHAAAPNGLPWVKAQVRRINLGAQTISLKHEDIPNMDMPGMTMVFKLKDPGLLQAVKVGDALQVTIEEINGEFTITAWQAMK